MEAYEILAARGVTRLCHFTKLQSLTHIINSENGIVASSSIRQDMKNVNDEERYDGEPDYVCCSVEYPNAWFLQKTKERNPDRIFRDWVVLYVDPSILKYKNAKFCPCNASRGRGMYINENMERVGDIFAEKVPHAGFSRTPDMLPCCPTDGQAEILIENNIPRKYINGIAVGDKDMAGRIYSMLKICGAEDIDLYIAPDVFTREWSIMIKDGRRPEEIWCDWSEEDETCLW